MKDLKILTGAKILNKKEQRFIKGGQRICNQEVCVPMADCCTKVTNLCGKLSNGVCIAI